MPVTAFLHGSQLAKDIAKVNDAARGKKLTAFGMALCLMKNYDPFKSPTHFKLMDLLKKFDKNYNVTGTNYGKVGPDRTINDVMKRRTADRWNFLFIAGMWFQDLFNYDFRRTEQCIIPYATQEGEISFCAYNTGVGWRNIIEKMHMTATLTKWYDEHGRHEIFAGGKKVKMEEEHVDYLRLREEIVTNEMQYDLDKLGIAKNAREEKNGRGMRRRRWQSITRRRRCRDIAGRRKMTRLTTRGWLRFIAKLFWKENRRNRRMDSFRWARWRSPMAESLLRRSRKWRSRWRGTNQLLLLAKNEGRRKAARFVCSDILRQGCIPWPSPGLRAGGSPSAPRLRLSPPSRPRTGWDGAKRRRPVCQSFLVIKFDSE